MMHVNIKFFASLSEYTGLAEARRLFDRGVAALVEMLPDYDRRGYSLYSHAPNPGLRNHFNIANPFYHRAHIRLLRKLHELTGREEFARFADRWLKSCNGAFDTLWAVLLIMFRDYSRIAKSI